MAFVRDWNGPAGAWAGGVHPYQRAWTVAQSQPGRPIKPEELPRFAAAKTYHCWLHGYLQAEEFITISVAQLSGEEALWVPQIRRLDPKLIALPVRVPEAPEGHYYRAVTVRVKLRLPLAPKRLRDAFEALHANIGGLGTRSGWKNAVDEVVDVGREVVDAVNKAWDS